VNSSRDKDDRLVRPEFGNLLITKRVTLSGFEAFPTLMGRDDKEGDYSALIALSEIIKPKK
jgi:hypothetical protein